jgi:hypothetical protein
MRRLLKGASRLVMVGVAASGLALSVSVSAARASAVVASTTARTASPPATGVTTGHNSSGDLYVKGPAATIAKFCPQGNELGFTCFFTGFDETGIGVAIYRGDNVTPGTKCDDIPLDVVNNVFDDTNEPIVIGLGTCANKGPIIGSVLPGVDENFDSGDLYDS